MAANFVKFIKCTKEAFDKLHSKDSNSLYFVEDTGEFYKGDVSFTDTVKKVEQLPEKPAKGKLYYMESTDVAKFWTGTEWVQLNHVIDTELTDEKATKNAVSGDAIKTYIATKLKNISSEGLHAEVKVSVEEGNKLEQKSDGLFVKSDLAVTDAQEDELVKTDSKGQLKSAGVKVGGATLKDLPDVKTLATEIAVNAVKKELNDTLSKKIDNTNVATAVAEGEPSEEKIISEKALAAYLSWTELS